MYQLVGYVLLVLLLLLAIGLCIITVVVLAGFIDDVILDGKVKRRVKPWIQAKLGLDN